MSLNFVRASGGVVVQLVAQVAFAMGELRVVVVPVVEEKVVLLYLFPILEAGYVMALIVWVSYHSP